MTNQNEILAIESKNGLLILTIKKPFSSEKLNVVFESSPKKEIEISATKIFENEKVVKFSVSDFPNRSYQINRVSIPDVGYIFLNKPFKRKSEIQAIKSTELSISLLEAKIKGQWIEFDPSRFENFDQKNLPFRFTIKTESPIEQVRLGWTVGKSIFYDNLEKTFGEIGLGATEVKSNFKVTHTGDNNFKVEFISMPHILNPDLMTAESDIQTADSGHRFLRYLRVTTADWNYKELVFRNSTSHFPYTREGLKLSERLRKSTTPTQSLCHKLF